MSLSLENIRCTDCIYHSDCFNKLIKSELEFISQNKTQIKYKKGETIYKQGSFSSDIMYIIEGYAFKYLEGTGNRNLIVKILKPSEYIGLSSLFCIKEHCYYSVSAVTDTVVCLIKKDDFKRLIVSNNGFAQEIIKWYCMNDEEIFNKLKSISNKNMHGRLAEVLLYINRNEYKMVNYCITRKNLAELAGISVESVIRILSEFKNDQLIDYQGKRLRLLNKGSLELISKNG